MDRRDFFKYSVTGIVGLSLLGRLGETSAEACKRDRYSVVILGDTHYDAPDPELYHAGYTDPNPAREANHRKEFVRNGAMLTAAQKDTLKEIQELTDKSIKEIDEIVEAKEKEIMEV